MVIWVGVAAIVTVGSFIIITILPIIITIAPRIVTVSLLIITTKFLPMRLLPSINDNTLKRQHFRRLNL